MTDSILRSYQYYSTTTIVPYPVAVLEALASVLLTGETQGFAIDATTYDSLVDALYVGGPVGGTIAVTDTGTPANNLSDVALDSSNLANSGTSPKVVHFPTSPYVRWSPHNYVLQSQTLDNAAWSQTTCTVTANATTAPDGTSTADRINLTGGGSFNTTANITILAETVYTVSVYVKAGTGADWTEIVLFDSTFGHSTRWWFNVSSGTVGTIQSTAGSIANTSSAIADAGSGWWRCSLTFSMPAAITTVAIYMAPVDGDVAHVDGDNGDTQFYWGVQLNRGRIATPYLVTTSAARIGIPQTYDVAASKYAMWTEAAATNILVRSEEFNTTWSNLTSSDTANAATAPDGSTTADFIVPDGSSSNHGVRQGSLTVTNVVHTFSVYAKAGVYEWIELLVANNGSYSKYYTMSFDLTNGVTGSSRGVTYTGSASITNVGGGWYRCTITPSALDANSTCSAEIYVSALNDFNTGSTGDTVNGAYLWGAQLEIGSVATSYIPTVGSTVTRAIDKVTTLLSTIPFSATAGTLYVDFKLLAENGDYRAVYQIDDVSSDGNRIAAYFNNVDNQVSTDEYSIPAGGNQGALTLGTVALNTRAQITHAWATNDIDAVLDGGTVQTDSSATLPVGLTTLRLGKATDTAGVYPGNLFVNRVVYIPAQVETRGNNIETWRYNF